MAENLQKKHLPFVVYISKGSFKGFCNILRLSHEFLFIFSFINFVGQFLKIPNLAECVFFSWKIFLHWTYFFSKCLLYLVLWNEQIIFFFWLWLPWKPKNGVFAVSVATFVEGKNSSAYFRKLIWTSIPWEFQPKATCPIFSCY